VFEIVSFVTKGYEDILDFSLPSMIEKAGADKIILFTDGMVKRPIRETIEFLNNPIIELREEYEASNDWHTWALRKPDMLKRYLKSGKEGDRFLLTDLDCLCMGSWRDPLEGQWWIRPIRWDKSIEDPNPKKMVAVFYGEVCDRMKQFADDWVRATKELSSKIKWIEGTQGLDQIALQIMMEMYVKEYGINGVRPLNENIWSSERDSIEDWKRIVGKYGGKVLHFKGRRWRDKELVKEMVDIWEQKTQKT
jgi:hypothetical protein